MTNFSKWTFDDLNYALITSYFALIAMINGYVISSGKFISKFIPNVEKRKINEKKLKISIMVMVILSILFLFMFLKSLSNLNYFSNMGGIRVTTDFLGKGIYHIPMVTLANMSVFLMFGFKNKNRLLFYLLLIYAFLASFITGYRLNIVTLLLSIFIIQHVMKPFKFKLKYLLLCFILFLLIGPIPYALRGGYGEKHFDSFSERIYYTISSLYKFDESTVYSVIIHGNAPAAVMAITSKLRNTGEYQYGSYFVGSLVQGFIPHFIWADRPNIGPELVNQYFWYGLVEDIGAPATSMIGEIYWDGGIIGIGLAFFLFGVMLKSIEIYRMNSNSNFLVAIFYAIFIWFIVIYSVETFVGAFSSWLIYTILLGIVYKMVTIPINDNHYL